MTIDKIVTGGVGYVVSAGDLPEGTLPRSGLYQRRPDVFVGYFGMPLDDRTASTGSVVDSHNIRDDALKGITYLVNPSDPNLKFLITYMPTEVMLDKLRAITPSKVYATSVFWHHLGPFDWNGSKPVKPAMMSELLAQHTRDGPLFRLTWDAGGYGRSPGQRFTAFMDEDDLANVEEQLLSNPRLLVDTYEHYFPGLVEMLFPEGLTVPQIHKPHVLEYARKHYQENLGTIERRERRRQVSVPPPKPKRRFPFF